MTAPPPPPPHTAYLHVNACTHKFKKKNLPTKATQKLDQPSSLNYKDKQITIHNACLSFIMTVVIQPASVV